MGSRVALVTGASRGIGKAAAVRLAADGHQVAVNYVRAKDEAEEVVAMIRAGGGSAISLGADVGTEAGVSDLFTGVEEVLGPVEVLVNNAGVGGPIGPIESMSLQGWKDTFEVNVHSAFLCLTHAVPLMKQARRGNIINISSTAGIMGYPLRTPYAAAKWAIIGLTKSLAMELGPVGIRVNAICPGSVDGPRMDHVIAEEAKALGVSEDKVRAGYSRQVSMRCFIRAQDIADTAVFLSSDKARVITGQALSVDGHNETLATIDTSDLSGPEGTP